MPVFPFINNQIFNPTILCGIITDHLADPNYPITISLDVEIRLEYRGANMTA